MNKLITISALGLFSNILNGQSSQVTTQGLYWIRYYNQTTLTKTLSLHFEADNRRFVNPDHQSQFFTHLHLHKKLSTAWDVAVGFNYNLTNSSKNWSLAVPELRPWQEVSWIKRLGSKLQLQLRYRVEERFIHNNNKLELQDGYSFNWRHRFRVQFSYPLMITNDQPTLTLKFSNEIMLNTGDVIHTFDQNRSYVSLEKKLSKKISLEVGYLYLYQSRPGDEFYARHIIRTTIYHKLNLSKN